LKNLGRPSSHLNIHTVPSECRHGVLRVATAIRVLHANPQPEVRELELAGGRPEAVIGLDVVMNNVGL